MTDKNADTLEFEVPRCPDCGHPRSSFNAEIGACEEAVLVGNDDVQPCFHQCEVPAPAPPRCQMDVLGDYWTICRAPSDGPCMCNVTIQALCPETCQLNKRHGGPCIFYRPVAPDFDTSRFCGKLIAPASVPQGPELRGCPFCGKPPQRLRSHPDRPFDDPCGKVRIRCVTYQCPLNSVEFKKDAWNTRPADADRVVKLEAMLRAAHLHLPHVADSRDLLAVPAEQLADRFTA